MIGLDFIHLELNWIMKSVRIILEWRLEPRSDEEKQADQTVTKYNKVDDDYYYPIFKNW